MELGDQIGDRLRRAAVLWPDNRFVHGCLRSCAVTRASEGCPKT